MGWTSPPWDESPLSYQKFVGQLQDAGNVTTVRHYLELLAEAFLIKLIPKYSGSIVREKAVSPKILTLDPALLHAFKNPSAIEKDPTWRGRVIENIVGDILCRKFRKVSYWQRQEAEVDFIVEHNDLLFAIEVKSPRPRKVSGLIQFLKSHEDTIPIVIDEHNLPSILNEDFSAVMPAVI